MVASPLRGRRVTIAAIATIYAISYADSGQPPHHARTDAARCILPLASLLPLLLVVCGDCGPPRLDLVLAWIRHRYAPSLCLTGAVTPTNSHP